MSARDPQARHQIAALGAMSKWAKEPDPASATAAARAKFAEKFYEATDPALPEAQRRRMAEYARRAYFQRLSLASAKARQARKASGSA